MPYRINQQTGAMEHIDAFTGNTLTPGSTQQIAPAKSGGFLRTVTNTLIPRTSQLLKKAGAGITLSILTDQAEEDRKKREKIINDLISKAKSEADPNRRSGMLAQARDLAKQGSDQINEAITNFEQESGTKLNDKDRVIAEALGVAGELGTFLIPAGKFATAEQTGKLVAGKVGQKVLGSMGISSISKAKQIAEATTAAHRILKGAKLGMTVGAISGATDPENKSIEDTLYSAGKAATIGGITGGAVSATFEGARKAAKVFLGADGGNKRALARLFHLDSSAREKFRKATGDMDFEAEILAREAKNIAGMNHEQLRKHFASKVKEAVVSRDEMLASSESTLSRSELVKQLQKKIASLSSKKGNVKTQGAIKELQGAIDSLSEIPSKGPRIGEALLPEGAAIPGSTGEVSIPINVTKNVARTGREVISEKGSRIVATKPVGAYGPVTKQVGEKIGRLVEQEIPIAVQEKDALIDLVTANRIKTQLQNAGRAAFSPSGKATLTSEALADASNMFKEAIENTAKTEKGNPIQEANRTIQLYQAARNAISKTGGNEIVNRSSGVFQKFLQTMPALAGVGVGIGTGNAFAGTGAALATMLVGGAAGAARVKFLSPEVQTSLISMFSGVLRKQGIQTADRWAVQISQEISKHIARYATLDEAIQESGDPLVSPSIDESVGINQPNQNEQQKYSNKQPVEEVQTSNEIGDVPHDQAVPQTVTIRNKKTGEKKVVSRSELRNYGLAADTPDSVPGLPTKGEILAAMVLDAQKGGKNIAKLKTILDAYDQVGEGGTAKGKTVPATQAGLLGDFDSAISLMSEVENVLSTNGKLFGPVKGAVGGANPYAVESQKADADLRRAAQIVGKAMEGGVLRKEDEIKYRKMLPKLTDTLDVANYKMNQVRDMLEKNRIQRIQALVAAGYDPETDKISGGVSTSNPLEY